MPLATINPATGETIEVFPELTPAEIDALADGLGRVREFFT